METTTQHQASRQRCHSQRLVFVSGGLQALPRNHCLPGARPLRTGRRILTSRKDQRQRAVKRRLYIPHTHHRDSSPGVPKHTESSTAAQQHHTTQHSTTQHRTAEERRCKKRADEERRNEGPRYQERRSWGRVLGSSLRPIIGGGAHMQAGKQASMPGESEGLRLLEGLARLVLLRWGEGSSLEERAELGLVGSTVLCGLCHRS